MITNFKQNLAKNKYIFFIYRNNEYGWNQYKMYQNVQTLTQISIRIMPITPYKLKIESASQFQNELVR